MPVPGGLSAPQVGAVGCSGHQYIGRVASMTTPFDTFVDELSIWANDLWFVWITVAVVVAAVVGLVAITRSRARARARVPRYRRHDS